MNLFYLAIAAYLAGGLFQFAVPSRYKISIFTFFTVLATGLMLTPALTVLINGIPIRDILYFPLPIGQVPFVLDGLSAFFTIIIAIIGIYIIIWYSGDPNREPVNPSPQPNGAHLFTLSVLMAFMLLVVVIQNALAFLIAWEIMSLASFFLIAYRHEDKEVFNAALYYLIAMHVGVILLICPFVILSIQSGSFDFAQFSVFLRGENAPGTLIFFLFFFGFGTKAGFFPFHIWLPRAYPAAPGHIAAILSAIMKKVAIYGILRIITLMESPTKGISYLVLSVGLISAFWGIMYAVIQRDKSRFLAYSSIENAGIIAIGIGLGMLGLSYHHPALTILGFGGCLIHILNHALFKSLLFLSASTVYQYTGHRDMEKMGGLIHQMPYTAVFSLIASAAACGLPPLNGFIGEFLLYTGMVKGIQTPYPLLNAVCILTIAIFAYVGATAMIAFTRMLTAVFLGTSRSLPPRTDPHKPKREATFPMLHAMSILAALCLFLGLFPQALFWIVQSPLSVLFPSGTLSQFYPSQSVSAIALIFAIFVFLFIMILLLRGRLLKGREVSAQPTWGCGYQAPNPYMQYSASSFSRIFLTLFKPIVRPTFDIENPESNFPQTGRAAEKVDDVVDKYFVTPLLKAIRSFFTLLNWVQSGSTQQYILYGLVFLVAAIIWVLGS